MEFREPPADAAEQVSNLSRRTAHAAYALYACWENDPGPALAREVVIYDREALSVHATATGLSQAQRAGLVERWPNPGDAAVWTMSALGRDLAEALEDRFLADTEPAGEKQERSEP